VLGRTDQASQHFSEAAGLAERCRSRPWIARIHHDWARSLGERPDLLDSARQTAEQLGMLALVASCDRALNDPGSTVGNGSGRIE
jgi:hypothetical protein